MVHPSDHDAWHEAAGTSMPFQHHTGQDPKQQPLAHFVVRPDAVGQIEAIQGWGYPTARRPHVADGLVKPEDFRESTRVGPPPWAWRAMLILLVLLVIGVASLVVLVANLQSVEVPARGLRLP